MTGRLILISHAETAATCGAAFPLDEPLTHRGRAAASRSVSALPRADHVLRSPSVAAAETAAAFGCEAAVDPMLADLEYGRWHGLSLNKVAETEPQALGVWLADPAFDGHGGTSIAASLSRITTWLEARRGSRGVTLAITHASVVRCAILATLDAPATGFWRLDVAPLTRVELGTDGRRWVLRAIAQADRRRADQK